jgi:hypothetical protein
MRLSLICANVDEEPSSSWSYKSPQNGASAGDNRLESVFFDVHFSERSYELASANPVKA